MSYHCPLVLKNLVREPFRCLDIWQKEHIVLGIQLKIIVASMGLGEWESHLLKEKLKRLKFDIKK